jgi:type I restriction enzyme S subunit
MEHLPSGTKQANLSNSDVLNVEIAVPPMDEQRKITDYVIKRAAIFEVAVDKAQSAIILLKERRTALISAAVTGKIDLRDWQLPEGTQAHSTKDIDQNEEALA